MNATPLFFLLRLFGNEISVQKLKDNLYRHNVTLIHYRSSDVHSTGHGNTGELVWINKQVHPKFFMPCYGYRSMTTCHAKAVEQSGFPKANIIIPTTVRSSILRTASV